MRFLDWRSDAVVKKKKKSVVLFANGFSPAHAVAAPHGRRQPMEARRGQFHNASCREDGSSIVLRAHRAVGEMWPPAASTRSSAAASQVMFFSPPPTLPLQTSEAAASVAALFSPCRCGACSSPLLTPVLSPPEPERRQICTARKRAAAAIIALIACFFCQAEISGGATILLKPPKTSE